MIAKKKSSFKDRRRKRSSLPKTWKGEDPKPAFDYNLLEQNKIPTFLNSSWNDPAIADFRNILFSLNHYDRLIYYNDQNEITLTITVFYMEDERCYVIEDFSYEQSYVLSQYKSRGNVQAFYSTEYGKPINLVEFDSILNKMTTVPDSTSIYLSNLKRLSKDDYYVIKEKD